MMKKLRWAVCPLFILTIAFVGMGFGHPFFSKKETGNLTVRFENLAAAGGMIRLALYDRPEHFLLEEKARLYSFKVEKGNTLEVEMPELLYGTYAFAVFQDENENMVMDKNLVGIPVEAYGFSKTPPSKWRLPKFDEVKFEFSQPAKRIVVRLEKWKL